MNNENDCSEPEEVTPPNFFETSSYVESESVISLGRQQQQKSEKFKKRTMKIWFKINCLNYPVVCILFYSIVISFYYVIIEVKTKRIIHTKLGKDSWD